MPVIRDSNYCPPLWLLGGHSQTIFPALFRRVSQVTDRGERLELPDGDFIDLKWAEQGESAVGHSFSRTRSGLWNWIHTGNGGSFIRMRMGRAGMEFSRL